MATDYLPSRDADLLAWSNNFSTKLSAAPESYGVSIEQAADYATLHSAFQAAYAAAVDPDTNSYANVLAKNQAKEALTDSARALARQIQGDADVTDVQKAGLGLTVRDEEPTPVPVPRYAPGLQFASTFDRTVTLRLNDVENPDGRGKPDGADGATIFTYIGQAPPSPQDTELWTFQGNTSRTIVDVTFPSSIPSGSTAWFTAFWFNPRKQSGPAALPISIQVAGTLPQAA